MKETNKRQKKIINTIKGAVNLIAVLGAFFLYGSLGALENGQIKFHQFIAQGILSFGLIAYSRHVYNFLFGKEGQK